MKLKLLFSALLFQLIFSPGALAMSNFHKIKITTIDGTEIPLSKFEGKTVLVVNTASACGYTPQYKGLEELFEKNKDKGLVILGVPCNQFGGQEPGTEEEIKTFCETKFHVSFPMTKKADVKGPNQHPLYKFLLENSSDKGDVAWNFEKFLVSPRGEVLARYKSKVEPSDPQLQEAITKASK